MERYHIFKLGLAILFYAAYCIRPMVVTGQKLDDSIDNDNHTPKFKEEDLFFYQGVQGKPGVDFPVLSHIPRTSFSCRDVESGYYADLETDCQVFHICEENKKISFLCPNGTIFQQSELICEWWFKVNCTNSPNLYEESAEQLREDNARRKLSRRVQHHGAVMRTEEKSSVSVKKGRNFALETKRASKRVFTESDRQDRRLSNHAETYRDEIEQNDLTRSSSSDFVRDRNSNRVVNVEKNNGNEDKRSRGRKPVQFQQQPKVDNENRNVERRRQRIGGRRVSSKDNRNNQQQNEQTQNKRITNPIYSRQENSKSNQNQQSYGNHKNKQKSYSTNSFISTFEEQTQRVTTSEPTTTEGNVPSENRRPTNFHQISYDSKPNSEEDRQKTSFQRQNNHQFSTPSGFTTSKPIHSENLSIKPNQNFEKPEPNTPDFSNHQQFSSDGKQDLGTSSNQKQSNSNTQSGNQRPNNFGGENQQLNENTKQGVFSNQQQEQNFDSNTNLGNQESNNFGSQNQEFSNSKQNEQISFKHQQFDENTERNYGTFGSQQQEENLNSNINSGNQKTNSFARQDQEFSNQNQNQQDSFKDQQFNENNRRNSGISSNHQQEQNLNLNSNSGNQKTNNFARQDRQFSNNKETGQDSSKNQQFNEKTKQNLFSNQQQEQNLNPNINSGNQKSNTVAGQDQQFNKDLNLKQQNQNFAFSTETPKPFTSNTQNNQDKETTDNNNQQSNQNINLSSTDNFDKKYSNSGQLNQNFGVSSGTQKPVPLAVNQEVPDNLESLDSVQKPKGFEFSTKNNLVNKKLVSGDSDEAQITQETASFYKNSFNRIEKEQKSSTNSYSNHRSTYSELKEPKFYSTKSFTSLSSVTPQYLTTQPINNGKPFIGSQVGTSFKENQFKTTDSYLSSTIKPFSTIGKTGRAFGGFSQSTTITPPTTTVFDPSIFSITTSVPGNTLTTTIPTTELFNVGRTDKTLLPLSTPASFAIKPAVNVTVPPTGSLNLGITGTVKPRFESSTGRVIDHATIYGKFVKSSATTPVFRKSTTTPANTRKIISLSKSLFNSNSNRITPTPSSSEILSASDSFNRNPPQVRFFGKVQTTTKIPGVEINFNGKSVSSKLATKSYNSFSTTVKPVEKTTFGGSTINPLSVKSTSSTPILSTSLNPEYNSVAPFTSSSFGGDSSLSTSTDFRVSNFDTTTTPSPNTYLPKSKTGFFVTKNIGGLATPKSVIGDIIRPRPFQLPPEPNFSGKAVYTSPSSSVTPQATLPTYKISSASPFSSSSTPEPTQPTYTSPEPTLPSTFENVDSMINALAEMATRNNFTDNPRPGLIIPPSAGPQTLHTLAVYFANALDGIATDKEDEEIEEENLTQTELEKKKLTELLTQMTMDRYNELFNDDKEVEVTTVVSRIKEDDDLEGQNSKGLVQETPKVRQLAKVFTQALSSYLDDPVTFRKVLEEVRPTEPPGFDEETTDLGDDELLNFSDADSKSSFPPFFPTVPSARPTWGYLLAYNTSQNLDVKNSINQEGENLQGADSQSFVSQFNKLQNSNKENHETTTSASIQTLPEDHWTTSPDVNNLWKKTFGFDPASINENFGTTEPTIPTTEEDIEHQEIPENHHEIKYELKALPQLELNSTQVHGILIDFMNTSKNDDDNRLQRILRKLNTTEDEFLTKMKEIEGNPLTRRLILLLINECGSNASQKTESKVVPLHNLINQTANSTEVLETASSNSGFGARQSDVKKPPNGFQIVDPSLADDSQDTRALQLLNSLYTIASRFGK